MPVDSRLVVPIDSFLETVARQMITNMGENPDDTDSIVVGSNAVVDPDGSGEELIIEVRPKWHAAVIAADEGAAGALKSIIDDFESRIDALENP